MRRLVTISLLVLVLVLVVLPTCMGRFFGKTTAHVVDSGSDGHTTVKVYLPASKQIKEMSMAEYLKGVVAAEMPASFSTEALKAQFVLARTFVVRRMKVFNGPNRNGCPLNQEADVCADPATGQAYMSQDEAARKMGTAEAARFWRRLDELEQATDGMVLRYHGELIDPLYHSVSGTYTEDAADYFGQSLPYLKPVDDHWGAEAAPKLQETKRFSPDQLAAQLTTDDKAIPASAMVSAAKANRAPVDILARTASNRVKTVKVGGVVLSGREFRERLGLRSTNFTVAVQDGQVVVTTVGNGHGVGLSQYGANGMALAGKPFQEILSYYYQDVTLSQLYSD